MRVHWSWCKPSKYCCVPSRDGQNWWRQFNLQCPRFLLYHLLSNMIEPLLSAASLFLLPRSQSKSVELNEIECDQILNQSKKQLEIEFWIQKFHSNCLCFLLFFVPSFPLYLKRNWILNKQWFWIRFCIPFISCVLLFLVSPLLLNFCSLDCLCCSTFLFPFLSWSSKCLNLAITSMLAML